MEVLWSQVIEPMGGFGPAVARGALGAAGVQFVSAVGTCLGIVYFHRALLGRPMGAAEMAFFFLTTQLLTAPLMRLILDTEPRGFQIPCPFLLPALGRFTFPGPLPSICPLP